MLCNATRRVQVRIVIDFGLRRQLIYDKRRHMLTTQCRICEDLVEDVAFRQEHGRLAFGNMCNNPCPKSEEFCRKEPTGLAW